VKIQIPDYLTQEKLTVALKQIIPAEDWIGEELKVPGTRCRWDMGYIYRGKTYIVEFDGDQHYRDSIVIRNDKIKDLTALRCNFKVIRIPYWLQLTPQTLELLFNINAEIEQNFSHGFVASKIFPASYCEYGTYRFEREFNSLPRNIKQEITETLRTQILKYDFETVLPTSLLAIMPKLL